MYHHRPDTGRGRTIQFMQELDFPSGAGAHEARSLLASAFMQQQQGLPSGPVFQQQHRPSSTSITPRHAYGQQQAGGGDRKTVLEASQCTTRGRCAATSGNSGFDYESDFFQRRGIQASGTGTRKDLAQNTTFVGPDGTRYAGIQLPPETYHRIYDKFQQIIRKANGNKDDIFEFGGIFDVSPCGTQLVVPANQEDRMGGRASIDVPMHIYEFHSHPNECRSAQKSCGLGPPSTTDLKTILTRQFGSNVCHLVFAYEGVYTVMLNPRFFEHGLGTSQRALEGTVFPRIQRAIDDFVGKRGAHPLTHEQFMQRWLDAVNQPDSPMIVLFFPLGQATVVPPLAYKEAWKRQR